MKFDNVQTIKEYILSNVREEVIFSYYLDIPVSDIIESLSNPSFKVKNKHRFEQNPSVRFTNRNKLRMTDYGSRAWCGDCFHIAGLVLRKDCNDSREFMYILNHIIEALIKKNITYIPIDLPTTTTKTELTKIDILVKDFSKDDYKYFNQYHIRNESLINTFSIENYWINNVINDYKYTKLNPAFAYYLGKIDNTILWKLYFPFKKESRFITNNKICIENINEIKGNRFLILTKSQKDKILLRQIFKDLNITTVDVYSTLSESVHIPDNILMYLYTKYTTIFSMFDNDKAGSEAIQYLAKTSKIYPFFFVGKSVINFSKDITDTSKDYGYDYVLNLIKESYLNNM